jgi:hypothetical protein
MTGNEKEERSCPGRWDQANGRDRGQMRLAIIVLLYNEAKDESPRRRATTTGAKGADNDKWMSDRAAVS